MKFFMHLPLLQSFTDQLELTKTSKKLYGIKCSQILGLDRYCAVELKVMLQFSK